MEDLELKLTKLNRSTSPDSGKMGPTPEKDPSKIPLSDADVENLKPT